MASQKLTEYERKRLENIKRNAEMVAALDLHAKAATVSAAKKRPRLKICKPKPEGLIVIRRSSRPRGMPPVSKGSADNSLKPISMVDAYRGVELDYNQVLIKTILSIADETQSDYDEGGTLGSSKSKRKANKIKQEIDENLNEEESNSVKGVVQNEHLEVEGLVTTEKGDDDPWLELLDMEPENEAYIMAGRIVSVKFFPCSNKRMIAAGNIHGNIAFWDMDCEDEYDDGMYIYRPHTGPISGILIQQHSMSKIYSSCNKGFIRLMDAEKEVFDLVHSCDDAIHYLSQQPNDSTSLYFAEGRGGLNIWDIRTGKSTGNHVLHVDRINTISFNSQNPNIMSTGSSDGTACIWDVRRMSYRKPKNLKTVNHSKAVNSAYFSPSGTSLATTSLDNNVGITSGDNFGDTTMIYHDNSTRLSAISFRGIWGWDDSYIFIGNMKKGIDVISPAQRRTVLTLQSPLANPIPYRFDAHPYEVGLLAAAPYGTRISVWSLGALIGKI